MNCKEENEDKKHTEAMLAALRKFLKSVAIEAGNPDAFKNLGV